MLPGPLRVNPLPFPLVRLEPHRFESLPPLHRVRSSRSAEPPFPRPHRAELEHAGNVPARRPAVQRESVRPTLRGAAARPPRFAPLEPVALLVRWPVVHVVVVESDAWPQRVRQTRRRVAPSGIAEQLLQDGENDGVVDELAEARPESVPSVRVAWHGNGTSGAGSGAIRAPARGEPARGKWPAGCVVVDQSPCASVTCLRSRSSLRPSSSRPSSVIWAS